MAFEYEPRGWRKKTAYLVAALSSPEGAASPREFNYNDQAVYPCKNLEEMSQMVRFFQAQRAYRILVFQAWEDSDGNPMWTIYDEIFS